jgi:hypothetical protein
MRLDGPFDFNRLHFRCHQNFSLSILAFHETERGYKIKSCLVHHAGAKGDRRCSSYTFLTAALEWDEWSA